MPTLNAFDNGDIRTTIMVGCFELWDFPKRISSTGYDQQKGKRFNYV